MNVPLLFAQRGDPGAAIFGLACGFLCVLTLGALIGGVILRAACSWYNKMAGARADGYNRDPGPRYVRDDPYDVPPARVGEGIQEGTDEPYPGIGERGYLAEPDVSARLIGVPEPSMGKAMGIVILHLILSGMVNVLVSLGLGGGAGALARVGGRPNMAVELGAGLAANAISLVIGTLIFTGLVSALLPTSFGRGFLVVMLDYLVTLIVVLAVLLVVGGFFVAVNVLA